MSESFWGSFIGTLSAIVTLVVIILVVDLVEDAYIAEKEFKTEQKKEDPIIIIQK